MQRTMKIFLYQPSIIITQILLEHGSDEKVATNIKITEFFFCDTVYIYFITSIS